jgi:tetratricopeptide (TPR) repeat protein
MSRLTWTIVNLLVPGTGLIVVRREWLGLSIALLYTVLAQIGLVGILIAPLLVPQWLVISALGGAATVWLASQWLFLQRLARIRDATSAEELASLRERAQAAMESSDYQAALRLLNLAGELDDEDLETAVARANLLTLLGRFREARSTWHRVRRLDRRGQYAQVAGEALGRLSDT